MTEKNKVRQNNCRYITERMVKPAGLSGYSLHGLNTCQHYRPELIEQRPVSVKYRPPPKHQANMPSIFSLFRMIYLSIRRFASASSLNLSLLPKYATQIIWIEQIT